MSQTQPARPLRVFLSFSSLDDAHRIELEKHLKVLQRQNLIEPWNFRKILPGAKWQDEERDALEDSDIFIALLTANFLASDYIHDVELTRAMERHNAGQMRVIPIFVSPCDWQHPPLSDLQVLPDLAKPVTQWDDPAEAWATVASRIRAFIDSGDGQALASAAISAEEAETRYLKTLRQAHNSVDIRGMGAQVSERLPLDEVYTRLRVEGTGPERDRKADKADRAEMLHEARDKDLADVLAKHKDVALIGDPGSGKTTFVRYVAQILARSLLEDEVLLEKIGLKGTAFFPVFIRLERFADFLTRHPDEGCDAHAVKHFFRYLDDLQDGLGGGLPPGHLRKRFEQGGCFVLLDGLDEVPGEPMRQRLSRLMENVLAAGSAAGNRHLLTCRTRAYDGFVQVRGITTAHLAPFGPAQIEQFVRGWSKALFAARDADKAAALDQARDYAKELLGAIEANPEGHRFAASPLMLTVLAVVHWNRRQLPEQRAELYHEAITYLLESRRGQAAYTPQQRRECLQALALAMFTDDDGVQRSFGRHEAAVVVQESLECDTLQEAIDFVEQEELYSGVLVSRTQGEVEFWHLMFQEYLAALELASDPDWWQTIGPRLQDDRWAEVILLLAGCRRREGGIKRARQMLVKVLDSGTDRASSAFAVALASRILRDIAPYGGNAADRTQYQEMLDDTLGIFEPSDDPVAESVRIEVGEALGRAGDPRLSDPQANRIRIEAGRFLMGAQDQDEDAPGFDVDAYEDESPVREVEITTPFLIGRYPVTVSEYRAFVDAADQGYLDPRQWVPDGWAARERKGWAGPKEWSDQLSHPNRPVVGVSWYEADAYARWIKGALPTEAQWEWVARGANQRRYPWGNESPSEVQACFDGRSDAVVPVGLYGSGRSEAGVEDLLGNVLEWCLDWWSEDYSKVACVDPVVTEQSFGRVLRGGAFGLDAHSLRAAFRNYFPPSFRYLNVGFRVVWRLPGGQT